MAKYITEVNVSINQTEEQQLLIKGFTKIDVDLNKGVSGSIIYLWYKKGSSGAITRIQTTFMENMDAGLLAQSYTKVSENLNAGAGGDSIYLWYFRGSTDYHTAIVNIDVTVKAKDEASKFTQGWERVGCDLNRHVGGDWIHIWVKREKKTYICDVTATDGFGSDAHYFSQGYVRMDEDVNRGADGDHIFIWYRQATDPKKAIQQLEISTTDDEYHRFQQQNFTAVDVNLNQGTHGNKVYLWYKRDHTLNSIKATAVLVNQAAPNPFTEAGACVIKGNLNTGNEGLPMFLCYYG